VTLGVNLFATIDLLLENFDQLLMRIRESHHLLPRAIVKRSIEPLKVLEELFVLSDL